MNITRAEYGRAYDASHDKTVHFLMARGVPAQQAEDAAQAAWTRGWEKRATLRKIGSVAGWINSIALNIFRNDYRRGKRVDQLDDPIIAESVRPDGPRVDVENSLKVCSPEDREMLSELYVAGYSSQEVAQRHGLKPSTVRVRMFRVRQKLQAFFLGRAENDEPS
ncbi:MAG: sigma-70 family RNA polymerase sigma factor [Bryobacterales bacterium]